MKTSLILRSLLLTSRWYPETLSFPVHSFFKITLLYSLKLSISSPILVQLMTIYKLSATYLLTSIVPIYFAHFITMSKLFVLLRPSLPHLDRYYNLFPTQASTILHFSPTSWRFFLHWSISINIQTRCDYSSCCWSSASLLLYLLYRFSAPLYSKIPWKNCLYSLLPHLLLNPLLSSIGPKDSTETTYFKVSSNLHTGISQLPIFSLDCQHWSPLSSFHLAFGIPQPPDSHPSSHTSPYAHSQPPLLPPPPPLLSFLLRAPVLGSLSGLTP